MRGRNISRDHDADETDHFTEHFTMTPQLGSPPSVATASAGSNSGGNTNVLLGSTESALKRIRLHGSGAEDYLGDDIEDGEQEIEDPDADDRRGNNVLAGQTPPPKAVRRPRHTPQGPLTRALFG